MRFQIVVKRGNVTTSLITGLPDVVNTDTLTVADVQKIPEVEAFLERLTGLRFHIEQLHESE